jgi:hypothetical protein
VSTLLVLHFADRLLRFSLWNRDFAPLGGILAAPDRPLALSHKFKPAAPGIGNLPEGSYIVVSKARTPLHPMYCKMGVY